MALTPRLEIKQSTSTLLTPQLRQAISLLQMTNLELNEVIEQELQRNPLLEREDDQLASQDDNFSQTIDDINAQKENPYEEAPIANDADYQNDFDDYGSDTEGYNSFENSDWSDYNASKINRTNDDAFDYFEQRLTKEKSLYEIIDEQIGVCFINSGDKIIAKILNDHLDRAGYFRGDIKEIAQKLKISEERVKKVLSTLQTFEPSGIFASSLAECLKIQLKDRDELTYEMEALVDNLELLAERKFKELAKICDCEIKDIAKLTAVIKTLNPKPASDYLSEKPDYIIPDVFVKRSKSGEYRVELNHMSLPKVLINHNYYTTLQKDKKASKYLRENLSHANFLIKAMHQRATNILRVCEEIVLRQYSFFENGIEHLKPMTLKDIAESIEVNESTVSRVTTGKYMSTPQGLFELKYFFSSAAGSYIGNDDTSTKVIKHKIKELIENEDKKHILSDDKIVQILGQEGIKIARRTVTKYRESMSIPTSAERKRIKRV